MNTTQQNLDRLWAAYEQAEAAYGKALAAKNQAFEAWDKANLKVDRPARVEERRKQRR